MSPILRRRCFQIFLAMMAVKNTRAPAIVIVPTPIRKIDVMSDWSDRTCASVRYIAAIAATQVTVKEILVILLYIRAF